MKRCYFLLVLGFLFTTTAFGQQIEYLEPKPLSDLVSGSLKSVQKGTTQVPMITWGGDVATIAAKSEGYFTDAGLDVELFTENNFQEQVEACLSGKTPYLRGTMGMINAAAEVFEEAGTDLVIVYQMTWSTGGDAMVVRDGINKPRDIKGKTVALQLFGPHMDYSANVLGSAGVAAKDVEFRWLRELTFPEYDTGGKVVDPVSAFAADSDIDAVMCIIPDGLALTSGGSGGTGAEGSVKGAKILLSTKTATRVIADVYAVRADYLSKNRSEVQGFAHALLQGQERLSELQKSRSEESTYRQILASSADQLLGTPQATADIEALLGDCEFVGHAGNVAFFTGKGTTRSMATLNSEIQSAFLAMGLVTAKSTLEFAGLDFGALAAGLSGAAATKPADKFDPKKVAQRVEQKIAAEPTAWAEEGTLFQIEITFEPNQSDFPVSAYAGDYKKALEVSQTYGGALVVIEGHSDPLGILKARQASKPRTEISQMEQVAKNLSLERSNAVRESFIQYCRGQGVTVDETQFLSVGMGVRTPKFSPPRTKDEWAANRRVVFIIKQVEAELEEFVPLSQN